MSKVKKTDIENGDALVRVGMGATINSGNYESIRIDIGISLPCDPDNIDETYNGLYKQVSDYLKEKVVSIKKIGGLE